MSTHELWRPSAPMPTLRLRAELLAAVRAFFAARNVLEVDTPALVRHAVTDVHIHCATVQLPGHAAPLYLHSSPEYAMKRMLAAGSGDIFQITHVFRGHETGRLHNAEFTLIEWYRCGYSMAALMAEVAQLARRAARAAGERAGAIPAIRGSLRARARCASPARGRIGLARRGARTWARAARGGQLQP